MTPEEEYIVQDILNELAKADIQANQTWVEYLMRIPSRPQSDSKAGRGCDSLYDWQRLYAAHHSSIENLTNSECTE